MSNLIHLLERGSERGMERESFLLLGN
uniref:Uncharacterized protein n=1 Tax=Anguilla anguilla TaxID=7936 RepID=A0A0E9TBF5_ANGAN